MMNEMTVTRTSAADPHFKQLIEGLDRDLRVRYQPYQAKFDAFNQVDELARVVIAYREGQPVGCGCFRPTDDPATIEIKRMFVEPAARGLGVARQILQELEKWAAEEGYTEARLETGTKQPEAIALYHKNGYGPIDAYGPYVGLSTSVCLGKSLVL